LDSAQQRSSRAQGVIDHDDWPAAVGGSFDLAAAGVALGRAANADAGILAVTEKHACGKEGNSRRSIRGELRGRECLQPIKDAARGKRDPVARLRQIPGIKYPWRVTSVAIDDWLIRSGVQDANPAESLEERGPRRLRAGS